MATVGQTTADQSEFVLRRAWSRFVRLHSPMAFAVWLASLLISIAIGVRDPFALSTRTKVALQAAFDHVTASAYPPTAAKQIALIEPGYADVTSGKVHFPIYYSELAQIIDLAQLAHAKAVFLDYEFSLPPSPPDKLSDLVEAIRDAKDVRVFTGPIGSNPELAPLKSVATEVAVRHRVGHPADYSLAPDTQGRLSPAAALYQVACAAAAARPSTCSQDLLDRIARRDPLPDIALQAGTAFPEEEARYVPKDEARRCRSSAADQILADLSGADPADPCPTHLTLSGTAALTDGYTAQLAEDLAGRVVIVGSGLDLDDDHDWPGVGRAPGVMFHAAALDNLLTWGPRYRRWPQAVPWMGGKLGWDDVVGLLLLFVIPAVILLAVRPQRPSRPDGAGRTRTLQVLLAPAVGLLAVRLSQPPEPPRPSSLEEPPLQLDPIGRARAFQALAIWLAAAALPAIAAVVFFWRLNWTPAASLTVLAISAPVCTAVYGEELARRLRPLDNWRSGANVLLVAAVVLAFLLLPPLWAAAAAALPIVALFFQLSVFVSDIWRRRRLHNPVPAKEPSS